MKTILLFALLILSGMATAQTIDNPTFKARTGSIHNITRIERTPEATKVFIHTIFRPNWWISEEGKSYLVDTATGIQYPFQKAEGIELNEKVFMPESGEKDYVLYFAPLPKETKSIHYIDPRGKECKTYGISLVPRKKEKVSPIQSIQGNWYRTDDSHQWEYGIYDSISILQNRIFINESVFKKGKNITVIAKEKRHGVPTTIVLTPQKNGNYLIRKDGKDEYIYTKQLYTENKLAQGEGDFTQFFHKDTAYIQGYINGYDPLLGFETGLIYLSNEMTREQQPIVATVQLNGRFEAKLPLNYPIENRISFGTTSFPFYIEPGQTLTMSIDWESVLEQNRVRDSNYSAKSIAYMGPSASLCHILQTAEMLTHYNHSDMTKAQFELTPSQFKEQIQSVFTHWDQMGDSLITMYRSSDKAIHLIKNKIVLKKGNTLFDFLLDRGVYERDNPTNQILKVKEDIAYYDFLKDMPLDDAVVLADNNSDVFINRFEFMNPLSRAMFAPVTPPDSIPYTYPKKSILAFLKEKGVTLNPEQEKLRLKQKEKAGKTFTISYVEYKADFITFMNFHHEQEELVKEFEKTYLGIRELTPEEKEESQINYRIRDWEPKAKYIRQLNANPNPFLWQVALTREAYQILNNTQDKNKIQRYADSLKTRLEHPVLIAEVERKLKDTYSKYKVDTYQLPNTKGAEIFRNIIKAHPDKVLLIDFWAISCGACMTGIEEIADLRKKYRNHPEFQFIYITSERSSPGEEYNKYIKQHMEGEVSYRVNNTVFNYLRELFHFNGMPHFELIEKDGSVSKQSLDYNQLKDYLEKRFGEEAQTLSK